VEGEWEPERKEGGVVREAGVEWESQDVGKWKK